MPSPNLLTDPLFKSLGETDGFWTLKVFEGVHAEAEVVGGVVNLPMKWTRGTSWHVELIAGPFEVKAGQRLGLAFDAYARNSFRFSVWLGQYDDPWQSLVPDNNHFGEQGMPKSWTTFKHLFKPECDEPRARLDFVLGRMDNTVRIRNPRLVLLDA